MSYDEFPAFVVNQGDDDSDGMMDTPKDDDLEESEAVLGDDDEEEDEEDDDMEGKDEWFLHLNTETFESSQNPVLKDGVLNFGYLCNNLANYLLFTRYWLNRLFPFALWLDYLYTEVYLQTP